MLLFNLMRLLNLMGVTTETFIRREFVLDDSRPCLHPFVVETKPYAKLKGDSLRMVAFILPKLSLWRVRAGS